MRRGSNSNRLEPREPLETLLMHPRQRFSRLAKELTNVRQLALGVWSEMVDFGQTLTGPRTSAASIGAPTLSTYFTANEYPDDHESGIDVDELYSKRGGVDFVRELPFELLFIVLSYLDTSDIAQCLQVSQAWNKVLKSETLWHYLYSQRFGPVRGVEGADSGPSTSPNGDLPPLNKYTLYRNQHLLEHNWMRPNFKASTLDGHTDSVYCSQMLASGQHVVTGSRDKTVRVWDLHTSKCTKVLETHTGSVLCVATDPATLVSGSSDGTCAVFSLPSYSLEFCLKGHHAGILDVQLTPALIFTCSKDRSIAAWSRRTGELVWRTDNAHNSAVNALTVTVETPTRAAQLFSAGGDGVIHQWCPQTGQRLRKFRGHSRGLACLKVDPGHNRIVSGGNDRSIRVWDLETGECTMTLSGHTNLIRSLHIVGSRIVSASYDRTIRVWNLDGECATVHNGLHGSWIFSVCGTSKWIVSTSIGAKPVILNFAKGLDPKFTSYL